MILFQLSFYTDTFGLNDAAAGTLLLMGGSGAFFDPMMGVMGIDHHTALGKFRPWVLAPQLPVGAVMYLAIRLLLWIDRQTGVWS